MIRNLRHLIRYWPTLTSVAILATVMAACAPASSPAPSPAETPAVPKASVTPIRTPGQGASGTLTKIDDSTLTLTTRQGQVAVNVSANTAIQKTVTATLADLQEGQFLTVIGGRDANGIIVASSITIRPQPQRASSNPPAGA